MKISSLLKSFTTDRSRRHFSALSEQSPSRIAFSIVKEKKLGFLKSFLVSNSDKGNFLKGQLEYHESKIIDAHDRKTSLSNDLLLEEMKWKDKLKEAEKKRDTAASNYFYNLLDLKLKVAQAEKSIQEQISDSKSSGIPFSIRFFRGTLEKVEEQKAILGKLEVELRNATNQLNIEQEKTSMRPSVERFQSARDDYRLAVSNYHIAKAKFDNFSKDASQIRQMIDYVSNTKQQGLSQMISFQFWMNVAKMFAISIRHHE